MTTQDTQQDHSDVDATVVEHPFAPEASIASETTTLTEAEEQVSTSSNEPAVPAAASDLNEKPAEASDETAAPPSSDLPQVAVGAASTGEEESAPPLITPVNEEIPTSGVPVSEPEKGHVEFPYRDVLSLAKENEKEVRPFTAFIEEFRLAEEQARRQVSLPEAPVEALNLLTPAASDFSVPTQDEAVVQEAASPSEEVAAPAEETAVASIQEQTVAKATESAETVAEVNTGAKVTSQESPAPEQPESVVSPAVEAGSPQKATSQAETEKVEASSSELPIVEKSVPTPPLPERAVSPLLRPASRVRTPRHVRHLREEAAALPTSRPEEVHVPATAPVQSEQPMVSEPAAHSLGVEKSKIETEKQEQPVPVEPPTPPRPARRYRFDRPASANTKATVASSPARVEENKETLSRTLSTARAETGTSASEQPAEATTKAISGALQAEQPASKQQGQEPSVQETPNVVAPAAPENGRRRGHDRQKETSAFVPTPATPVVEPVSPVVEPANMQLEEIAPEDLPPLEYAELQKTTTTRRRRRHRSSSSNGSSAAAAAEATAMPVTPPPPAANANSNSVVPPAAPGASPSAPAASRSTASEAASSSSNYSIVSGYTVSQMNQGNDHSGPFMGPDPSPARGSVTSRDGRTTNRAEAHRTPTPLYPGRTHTQEGGLTTAAFNQLTNSLVQSLQNQTDRMVAELRRSNAAPTNVSVSLPPFPSTERVGVFVDVANLLYSARTLRMSVDFGKLLDFLRGNRRLVRAHAYCPTSPQAGDEQMFLQAVKGLGYRITTKNYKTFSSGAKKADLDLDLCMDVVRLVDGRAVDCVVLVSGDSDFMPMLDYCSDHGVRVEVAAFDEAMSATLRQSCDLFVNLSMLEEIRS